MTRTPPVGLHGARAGTAGAGLLPAASDARGRDRFLRLRLVGPMVLFAAVGAVLACGCSLGPWDVRETLEPAATAQAGAAAAQTAGSAALAVPGESAPATTVRDCSARPLADDVAIGAAIGAAIDSANDLGDTGAGGGASDASGAGNRVIDDAAAVLASVQISRALYDCADEIGLAFADDSEAILTLAARGIGGPLLLVESWSATAPMDAAPMAEIRRLAPERIVAAGFNEQRLRQRLAEIAELADLAVEWVPVNPEATLPQPNVPPERVWIVTTAEEAAVLGSLGRQLDAAAVAAGPAVAEDVRAMAAEDREMLRDAERVELLADLGADAAWQLEVVRRGEELPGGGLLMFEPGRARRLVAMYGHPSTSQLGVLGEQDPSEGVTRLRSIAAGYDADGSDVLPTFEIIATVASAQAGRDGDYSNETAIDDIRPWVETAAANDMYVVLDLQPGRTDFLSQAKQYEELLRLPHVGLALDPEWRLKPGQLHLRQIGTVDAAEINQVVRWLAGLVRQEALPQKLLVLHQFRFSMITNRELVETPAELAVLVHMDGQGAISTKYSTWDALTGQPDAHRFYWGWKNFYDEDFPTPTAPEVLALSPSPLFVSYQ